MNIQVLIPDCLDKPMGGMGEQARNLFSSFSDKCKFSVIGSSKQQRSEEQNISYYPVMDLSKMSGMPDPLGSLFLDQSLFVQTALTNTDTPDIVHAFDWSTFWAGRILARHYNVPLVVTIQLSISKMVSTPHPAQAANHSLASAIEMSGMVEADAIIQVSENYKKQFSTVFANKTFVIENGINNNEWRQENKYNLPGKGRIKLIYIGRFAEMKNIDTLLDCEIPEEIDLIFIGSPRGGTPELFQRMLNEVKQRDNLHYLGPKYGQEKIDLLFSADAVIVPSVHEPFGIVALEALASNNILLSSFEGGMGNFLTPEAAINCGTHKATIESALDDLLQLSSEDKTRMKYAGREICRSHDWTLQAAKLQKVYEIVYESKSKTA